MYVVTRSKTGNRKRRQYTDFDLSETSQPTVPKKRRYYRKKRGVTETNMNSNDSQFQDLSGTIMTGNQGRDSNTVPNLASGFQAPNLQESNLEPEVRDLVTEEVLVVQRSLEDKVRRMVHEEMADVRKTIGELTMAVKELGRSNGSSGGSGSQNNSQHNNNNLNNERYRPNGTGSTRQNRSSIPQERPLTHSLPLEYSTTNPVDVGGLPADGNNCQIRIRIDKFGLLFNGNTSQMSIEDFVFRLECVQTQYDSMG